MMFASLLLSTALSAGNAEFDKTSAESAWMVAAERCAAELAERGPEKDSLKNAMLSDPAAHRTREESEKKCREIHAAAVRKAYEENAEAVRRRLGLAAGFSGGEGFDPLAKRPLDAKFDAAFAEERKSAVEEQAKGLATAIRPTETEFEEKTLETLSREMTDRVVAEQKFPVFDENKDYITTALVKPVLESAAEERRRQAEFVKHAKSDGFAPSAIAADLVRSLEKNVSAKAAKADPSMAWGVFPSVAGRMARESAEKRTKKAFTDRISDIELSVTTNDVLAAVAAVPSVHFTSAESEKAFAAGAAPRVAAMAREAMRTDAPEDQRAELAGFLDDASLDEDVRRAAERQVRRDAVHKWRKARADLAGLLARETWPSLADGTWYPDSDTADSVATRSDWKKAVVEWRKIPSLETLAAADAAANLVEESAKFADAKVAEAFDIARSAISAQSEIVDEVHPSILADSRARKESFFRRTPDLAAITERLTKATEEKWEERRVGTLWPDGNAPSNAEEQHRGLFPSVLRKIELVARQILEEMEKPEEETKNEESLSEEEVEEFLYSISARKIPGGYELVLKRGEESISEERVQGTKDGFLSGIRRLAEKLFPMLRGKGGKD